MSDFEKYFIKTTNKIGKYLEDPYVATAVALFLVLYGGIAAPNLPNSIARLYDYQIVRIFSLLIYVCILIMLLIFSFILHCSIFFSLDSITVLISFLTTCKFAVYKRLSEEIFLECGRLFSLSRLLEFAPDCRS